MKAGILFRTGSLWIGAHYSKANKRWCINLLPMVTIWFSKGNCPVGFGWRFK